LRLGLRVSGRYHDGHNHHDDHFDHRHYNDRIGDDASRAPTPARAPPRLSRANPRARSGTVASAAGGRPLHSHGFLTSAVDDGGGEMNPRLIPPSRLARLTVLRSQSDERLVLLVREGSEAAFEAIVLRYRRSLVKHCTRLMG